MLATNQTDVFERLLDAVPAPVLVANLQGTIIRINHAAHVALGYRLSDGPLSVAEVYHRLDDARRVVARLRARADQNPGDEPFDVILRARNGELVPVRLTASFVRDAAGSPVATLGVFQDRREQIAIERRLEEAADHIEAAEHRAAGIASVAMAVHELAQPLTAAMGSVEMLLIEGGLRDEQRNRLERTYEQLERIRGLLSTLSRAPRRASDGDASR